MKTVLKKFKKSLKTIAAVVIFPQILGLKTFKHLAQSLYVVKKIYKFERMSSPEGVYFGPNFKRSFFNCVRQAFSGFLHQNIRLYPCTPIIDYHFMVMCSQLPAFRYISLTLWAVRKGKTKFRPSNCLIMFHFGKVRYSFERCQLFRIKHCSDFVWWFVFHHLSFKVQKAFRAPSFAGSEKLSINKFNLKILLQILMRNYRCLRLLGDNFLQLPPELSLVIAFKGN